MDKYLEIGQIVNTFGIRGQVKIRAFTDDVKRFDKLKQIYINHKENLTLYKVENVKYTNNFVIIKFKDIEKIEDAEKFKGDYLKIDRKDAIKLPENTYFIADLIGLNVYTDKEELLGTVYDIYNTGSNDIYVVKDELGKQILIPAISDVLKKVDLDNKKIIVHLIKGLLD